MGKELDNVFYNDVYKIGGSEEIYFKKYSETPWVEVWSEIINEIKLNNFKNVLDIGCGPGQFADFLNDSIKNINFTGLDFSSVAIDYALKTVQNFTFICDNALTFDFKKINYDVVVITEFLEHIEQDLQVLSNLNSGVLILATLPNMDSEGHVRFLSKDFDTAKEEIMNHYGNICEIMHIKHYPYELNPTNGDYLIKMKLK